MYFRGKGPVPETLRNLTQRLSETGIPFVIMGATALNAHGHERMTKDIDVSMRREGLDKLRAELVGPGRPFQQVAGRRRRFVDPRSNVTIDVLVAGEIAGREDKQTDVRFPEPSEAEMIEGLPVVSLARLIELKLVTWRYKDWGDVVELIRIHDLDESFTEKIHSVTRSAYLQCLDQKRDEDRYNPEIHDAPPETPK